jgi:hypothetical protein
VEGVAQKPGEGVVVLLDAVQGGRDRLADRDPGPLVVRCEATRASAQAGGRAHLGQQGFALDVQPVKVPLAGPGHGVVELGVDPAQPLAVGRQGLLVDDFPGVRIVDDGWRVTWGRGGQAERAHLSDWVAQKFTQIVQPLEVGQHEGGTAPADHPAEVARLAKLGRQRSRRRAAAVGAPRRSRHRSAPIR